MILRCVALFCVGSYVLLMFPSSELMASAPGVSQDDGFTHRLGSQGQEARYFVNEIHRQEFYENRVETYVLFIETKEDELAEFAEQIPVPEVDGIVRVTEVRPPDVASPRFAGDGAEISSLRQMLISSLYNVIEEHAKQAILVYFVERIKSQICRNHKEFLRSTCALEVEGEESDVTLTKLQNSLREDLFSLPERLVETETVELKAPLECGFRLALALRDGGDALNPVETVVSHFDKTLRHESCSTVVEVTSGSTTEWGLQWLRLIAATYSVGDDPSKLRMKAVETVLQELSINPLDEINHGEQEVMEKLAKIERYLDLGFVVHEDTMQDREVEDRELWQERKTALKQRLEEHRAAREAKLADVNRKIRADAKELLLQIGEWFPFEQDVIELARVREEVFDQGPQEIMMVGSRLYERVLMHVWRGSSFDRVSLPDVEMRIFFEEANYENIQMSIEGIRATRELSQGQYHSGLSRIRQMDVIPDFMEHFSVIVGISRAENEEELIAVMTRQFNPPGTWKGRREQKVFGISGQFGISLAVEDFVNEDEVGLGAGMSVPIGVDYSRPSSDKSTMGVMFQVLDLGTIGSARVLPRESNVHVEPNIGVVQVFAPGVRGYYGFKDTPIIFSVYVDYVPALRKEIGAEREQSRSTLRAGFGITVDVPLLTLRTR